MMAKIENHPERSEKIKENPELYIKWMCYNLLITIDNQVFNLSFERMKEQLIGGSFCFFCNFNFFISYQNYFF